MTTPDLRETLDPDWEILRRARCALVWDVHWEVRFGGDGSAKLALAAWESAHAGEWNRLKPWYAERVSGDHAEFSARMRARFEEKQRP